MLAALLTFVRNNPFYGSLFREVVGSNVPHTVVVGSVDEGIDEAVQQFSGTLFCYGGAGLTHVVWNAAEKALNLTGHSIGRTLGKTIALYGAGCAGILAMPFLRNGITLHRTKTERFVDFSGVNNGLGPTLDEASLKAKKQALAKSFFKTLGIGAGLVATSFALTQLVLRKAAFPAMLEKALKPLLIPNGQIQRVGDAFAVTTGIAAYAGVILGARDKVERQEWMIKASAFPISVILAPTMAKIGFEKLAAGSAMRWAGGVKNAAELLKLGMSTMIYGMIPTVVALFTRKHRARKAGLLREASSPIAEALDPSTPEHEGRVTVFTQQAQQPLVDALPINLTRSTLTAFPPVTPVLPIASPSIPANYLNRAAIPANQCLIRPLQPIHTIQPTGLSV